MENQKLGEVFNSLSVNISARNKKYYQYIFIVFTLVLFSYKPVGAKECSVGPLYVEHPCVSADVSKASYACRRYLLKYEQTITREQEAYDEKYHSIFSKLQAERVVLNAGIGAKKQLEETLDKLWNNLSKEQREVLKIALGNSVEDLTERMALVKKLEEDLNNSCPPQKKIIKSE